MRSVSPDSAVATRIHYGWHGDFSTPAQPTKLCGEASTRTMQAAEESGYPDPESNDPPRGFEQS